ncbi:MAG: lytic transglycosylase domain-containing protein, partial [Pseudomonadota bacterium]
EPEGSLDPLLFNSEVDPELRNLMRLGPPLPPPDIPPEIDTSTLQKDKLLFFDAKETGCFLAGMDAWLFPEASAATNFDTLTRLNSMAPDKDQSSQYLPLVRQLLQNVGEEKLVSGKLDAKYHQTYRNLMLAVPWQESCWRQYIKSGNTLVPLTSTVGSAGLMQVNQNVWRGIYDGKGLLRDIVYNARAGSEIILYYLQEYAIEKGEHLQAGGMDNLPRATYAAYNGGPGQRIRYRSNETKPSLKKIDDLFWEKYCAVKQGRVMDVVTCYN